jgi:formyltetrahydrofolate-dependent phosphoribosylglycinamide formyltransferase
VNIAVFVSGRGSNLQAILDAEYLKGIINVAAIFSDKEECRAFSIAEKFRIPVFTIGKGASDINYEEAAEFMEKQKVELVVLAGYLKLLPVFFVEKYTGRIINIHPALLPKFGGKGMYGMNVHKAVFNSHSSVSGPTVHFVDASYDTGRIIAQKEIDITSASSPEEIAELVLKEEHKLLPFVIWKFALGEIKDNKIIIENSLKDKP